MIGQPGSRGDAVVVVLVTALTCTALAAEYAGCSEKQERGGDQQQHTETSEDANHLIQKVHIITTYLVK